MYISDLTICTMKNGYFWTVVLEKTLEGPLDCKEIQPVHSKGDPTSPIESFSWVFIGRTDAEDEAPVLCPPDAKSWLVGKDPDAGKDWRRKEKGTTEDEMVGWHHRLNGYEFEQALGVGDGQGDLACGALWVKKRHNWAAEQKATPGSEDKGCVCLKEMWREMTPINLRAEGAKSPPSHKWPRLQRAVRSGGESESRIN